MIFINKPYIVENNEYSRLVCNVSEDDIEKEIYFEVEKEYGKYLCFERCDAFVIGYLSYAMQNKHDIKSETPITDELLYNINEYLIPALTDNDERLSKIKITAPIAPALDNAGGVGTGISCGVDSFHAILNNINSQYPKNKLTHVCINNVGAFNVCYEKYGIEKVKNAIYIRAEKAAKELNIPIIKTDSNFQTQCIQDHLRTNTYSSMLAVFCLQKLWKTYFYSSSGYDLNCFNLKNSLDFDSGFYDLLSLNCFSTRKLRVYSEGMAKSRFEKTRFIADNKTVQKYLHVCVREDENCGVCTKCKRTILTLDTLGKLENFSKVFDIDYYKKHKNEYLIWLYKKALSKNNYGIQIYRENKIHIPLYIKLYVYLNKLHILSITHDRKRKKKKIKIFGIKLTFKY